MRLYFNMTQEELIKIIENYLRDEKQILPKGFKYEGLHYDNKDFTIRFIEEDQ